MIGKERDYETEQDAKTLHDGHHIRKDKLRHKKAIGHLKKMSKHSTHAADTHKHESGLHDEIHGGSEGSSANAAGEIGATENV